VDSPVRFTLNVRNISTTSGANNVVVKDTLPEGLEFVHGSAYTPTGTVAWDAATAPSPGRSTPWPATPASSA
jgi:uncharacterized repeat protein (TIGR01451 family)